MEAQGTGNFDEDIITYPGLYLYDSGAIDENPRKGCLNYG